MCKRFLICFQLKLIPVIKLDKIISVLLNNMT